MGFFNRIESFITRFELYNKISPTPEMVKMVAEVMAEILFGLVLVEKYTHQGRFSKLILPTNSTILTFPRGICRNAIRRESP